MEYDQFSKMMLGSVKLDLCVIIVGKVPACVVSVLYKVRGGPEGSLISKISPMCMCIRRL